MKNDEKSRLSTWVDRHWADRSLPRSLDDEFAAADGKIHMRPADCVHRPCSASIPTLAEELRCTRCRLVLCDCCEGSVSHFSRLTVSDRQAGSLVMLLNRSKLHADQTMLVAIHGAGKTSDGRCVVIDNVTDEQRARLVTLVKENIAGLGVIAKVIKMQPKTQYYDDLLALLEV